jgi:hypothetical protein
VPVEISKNIDLADQNQIAEGRGVTYDRHGGRIAGSRTGASTER